ncbi:MAG TPA: hypothetical protein VJN02_12945 [Gammaproteobacteria bacterium]|nr:hypothetical protein [Gammaproteobacteria bacterium]
MKKLMIFLVCFAVVYIAGAVDLNQSQCYYYNISDFDNLSNVTYFHNETFCCLNSSVANIYLNFSLNPGELLSGNQNYCYYNLSAKSCTNVNGTCGKCVIDKTLNGGEKYSKLDAACDLDIECTKTSAECDYSLYDYEIDYEAKRIGDTVILTANDQVFHIDVNNSQYFSSWTQQIKCPLLKENLSFGGALTFEQCEDYLRYFDKGGEVYKMLVETIVKKDENFAAQVLRENNCSNQLVSQNIIQEDIQTCNERRKECEQQALPKCESLKLISEGKLESVEDVNTFYIIMMLLFLCVCILEGVLLFRKRQKTPFRFGG